jgi:hypothetical protein
MLDRDVHFAEKWPEFPITHCNIPTYEH